MADRELTFINCPSCGSLIPATAIRCRMCGLDLSRKRETRAEEEEGNRSRVKQNTTSMSVSDVEDLKGSVAETREEERIIRPETSERSPSTSEEKKETTRSYDRTHQEEAASSRAIGGEERGQFRFRGREKDAVYGSYEKAEDRGGSARSANTPEGRPTTRVIEDRPVHKEEEQRVEKRENPTVGNRPVGGQPQRSFDRPEGSSRASDQVAQRRDFEDKPGRREDFERKSKANEEEDSDGFVPPIREKAQSSGQQTPAPKNNLQETAKSPRVAEEISPNNGAGQMNKEKEHKNVGPSIGGVASKPVESPHVQPTKKQGRLVGWFVHYSESGYPEPVELYSGKYLITGSKLREGDMVIADPSLSSPHAMIHASQSQFFVLDMMSDNGTAVRRVGDSDYVMVEQKTELNHGDRIRFGEYELVICLIPQIEDNLHKG